MVLPPPPMTRLTRHSSAIGESVWRCPFRDRRVPDATFINGLRANIEAPAQRGCGPVSISGRRWGTARRLRAGARPGRRCRSTPAMRGAVAPHRGQPGIARRSSGGSDTRATASRPERSAAHVLMQSHSTPDRPADQPDQAGRPAGRTVRDRAGRPETQSKYIRLLPIPGASRPSAGGSSAAPGLAALLG
jgi:hypothetical protein